MSVRYRWQDVFWFTFFHELGHLLIHGRRARFVDVEPDGRGPEEDQANSFAADTLVPRDEYERFLRDVRPPRIAAASVKDFARRVGVAPAIVVGRLQHDDYLMRSHLNRLRQRFVLREAR